DCFHNGTHKHLVVIGKDTRLSGYMLEPALTAGFITMGMDVVLVGPLPTPAIAMLTRSLRADIGVVISASHNPFADNGIKLFGPDGFNINRDCGALAPEQMRQEVLARRADIGIALDGDADRLIVADERGVILDGDQLMALIATSLARGDRLAGGALVATVMSNLGLERCLGGHGIALHRTAVGDRYVVEKMRAIGCNLGGEQS